MSVDNCSNHHTRNAALTCAYADVLCSKSRLPHASVRARQHPARSGVGGGRYALRHRALWITSRDRTNMTPAASGVSGDLNGERRVMVDTLPYVGTAGVAGWSACRVTACAASDGISASTVPRRVTTCARAATCTSAWCSRPRTSQSAITGESDSARLDRSLALPNRRIRRLRPQPTLPQR